MSLSTELLSILSKETTLYSVTQYFMKIAFATHKIAHMIQPVKDQTTVNSHFH